MYINLKLFFRAQYLSLFKTPFRLRRWAFVFFFTALYWGMWFLVAFGRMLDYVFYPGFRKQEVREPVFIVAPPRSGTTLTQKLMALDEERLVHAKLYRPSFLPSAISGYSMPSPAVDQRIGHPLGKVVSWAEKKFFGGWDDMHKMRLDQPEEDDGFFVYSFVTEAIYLLFPHVDELWEAGFPDALAPEDRRKLMGYYRSCLQRQLYANGPNKTLLSKATQSSGAVESLLEEFPMPSSSHYPASLSIGGLARQRLLSGLDGHSPDIAKDGPVSKSYARLAVKY